MTTMTAPADLYATRAYTESRLERLYEANAAGLLRTMLSWTRGDRQAAEDLLQETMLRAWQNLPRLHENPKTVRPWLLTVGRRLSIDAVRARAARPPEVDDAPLARVPADGEPYEQVVNRQLLEGPLAGLSQMHRDTLFQVYYLQRSVRQAAEALGVPEGTVKSRTHTALRALRDALGESAR
ncbi:sigma-70 family RNA polymerase sigma factor [Kitasatospora sp. NPDC048296]|uniref:sigma-70 family RNA polymerase sigma factor n=1 Tax=Kitasatospora sp. NPDC048296 TaxID=3364048 RepID=UPI003716CDC9